MSSARRSPQDRLVVLLATLVIATAPGCGNDTPSSRAGFVSKANAICRQGNSDIEALGPLDGALADQARKFKSVTQVQRNMVASLRQLTPPPGDEAFLDANFRLATEAFDLYDAGSDAALRGDQAASNDLWSRGSEKIREANEQLDEFGASECAEDPTA